MKTYKLHKLKNFYKIVVLQEVDYAGWVSSSLLRSLTVWKMAIAFVPDFALGRDNLIPGSSI